ncbi:Uncharacterised protein [Acinetobacter baumannii]|nr:Uncharacterised protein [Acinetobacter baumannii]SSQ34080.1 Uncharacterised protein [Acinetobacter baumannii]SSQ39533.1 Uncharacterised protein [Acinetobacter baumannii]SVJ96268.1 Uncharacterised protein [Acinetobacter baumannii]
MGKKFQTLTRLDKICLQRLTSLDFAQKTSFKSRIILWMKGGAK